MKVASPSRPSPFEGIHVPEWMERAECIGADPEAFFDYRRRSEAVAYCADCEVIKQCRKWAKKHRAYGIFGGRGMWLPKTEPEPQEMKPPKVPHLDWRTDAEKTRLREKNARAYKKSALARLSSEERKAVLDARRERRNETSRLRKAARSPEQREKDNEARRRQRAEQ